MRIRGISIIIVITIVFFGGYLLINFDPSDGAGEIEVLREENNSLKRQLAFYEGAPENSKTNGFEGLSVKIFSSYPFNDRSLIVVGAGNSSDVKQGMTVVSLAGNLLGQVEEVHKYYSVVKTIFDSSWSSPVLIKEKTDGLLIGGVKPRIELVNKDSDVSRGDSVSSAGRNYPYGLLIGSVGLIDEDPAKSFKEAVLNPEVTLNSLKTAFIIMDFNSD